MVDKKITTQELKSALKEDIDMLVEQVAQAINEAQPGRIINDSEEPVRNASAAMLFGTGIAQVKRRPDLM
jgi:hypothetical protein